MIYSCRIDLLGGIRVEVLDRSITRFQTQKTGALLAYLAMHPERNIARELVAEVLWPNGEPNAIRNRLNQAVSSLRRQLHPPQMGTENVLIANHYQLGLNWNIVSVDVFEFQHCVRSAHDPMPAEEQLTQLRKAATLYKGDLLAGMFEDWCLHDRLQLSELCVEALDRLIRLLVEQGELEEALEHANRRLMFDQDDEAAHAKLMRLYLRLGKPRAALRQFDEIYQRNSALGLECSPAILRLKLRAEAELEEFGGVEQEAAWEDDAPVVPATAPSPEVARPALVHPNPVNASLPRIHTKFVGRNDELDRLRTWWASPDARMISIVGMGGTGKTRLSIEFSWHMIHEQSIECVFLGLEAIERIEDYPKLLQRALQLDGSPVATAEGALSILNGAQPMLFILDNLEHLIESDSAIINPILDALPNAKVVVTTRRPTRRSDESILSLQPLPVPTEDDLSPVELVQFPAVALLLNRAQSVRQDFQVTDRTSTAIARLARSLEGIPLAIELVATWTRTMSASQMADAIESRWDLLADRRRDISHRHRSMYAVAESSFALLASTEQDAFARLSVFRSSFTHESAQWLCPDVDIVQVIAELQDASMIQLMQTDEPVRFEIFDVLRKFGLEKLSRSLEAEVRWLHARYFFDLASRFEEGDAAITIKQLVEEWQEVSAALDWAMAEQDWEFLGTMAANLAGFWYSQGQISVGLGYLELALPYLIEGTAEHTLCQVKQAELLWRAQRTVEAEAIAVDIRERLRDGRLPKKRIAANFLLALEAHRVGNYDRARELLHENIALAKALGDRIALEHAWRRLGNASVELGEYDKAFEELVESLRLARELGHTRAIALALISLGHYGHIHQQYAAAEEWLTEAIHHCNQMMDVAYRRYAALTLTQVRLAKGETLEAARLYLDLIRPQIDDPSLAHQCVMGCVPLLDKMHMAEPAAQALGHLEANPAHRTTKAQSILLALCESAAQRTRTVLGSEYDDLFQLGYAKSTSDVLALISESIASALDGTNRVP